MAKNKLDLQFILQALEEQDSSQIYLKLLQTLAVVGVADKPQLEQATQLSRNQMTRLLEKLHRIAGEQPPLVELIPQTIARPGARGRAPQVFGLGETGAAILRTKGQTQARACELKDTLAITHALAMLDVYLVARLHEHKIQADQNVPYGNDKVLRPDIVITLADDTRLLFEIEQSASPDLLRRIVESVQHKLDFFSANPPNYSPTIRMVIALPRGEAFDKTVRVWQEALNIVNTKAQRALPFRMLAQSLTEFIAQPDWSNPPDADRWLELKPISTPRPKAKPGSRVPPPTAVPKELTRTSARDDALILRSLWLFFQESAPTQGERQTADPAFFDVMRLIYAASHGNELALMAQAQFPYESLFMLRQYLLMHPRLKEQLQAILKRRYVGGGLPMIVQRMQTVINAFLEYHGWRSYGPLRVYASRVDFESEEPQGFAVNVQIAPALLTQSTSSMELIWDVDMTQRAIAWVLWAFFNYTHHLGFDVPAFW